MNDQQHFPEEDGTVHHDAFPQTVIVTGGALHIGATRAGEGPVRVRISDDRRPVAELDASQVRDLIRALLEAVEACYAPPVLYAAR